MPDSCQASACAKIILLGEHAVVYGQPALAVPVSGVRAHATAQHGKAGSGMQLCAPALSALPLTSQDANDSAQVLLMAARNAARWVTGDEAEPDLALTLHSEIPLARGMGSSAAVCAAITRAVCGLYDVTIGADDLSALVYQTETILHGAPSGVDNTVVSFERAVWFTRGRPPAFVRVGAPLQLLIGDTGVASRTQDTVAAVRRWRERDPSQVDAFMAGIGALVTQARGAVETGDLAALGQAMSANHPLLQQLGVSTPQLDALVQAARAAGALGAKLTGGGGGGCIVALVTPDSQANVERALIAAQAHRVYQSTVPPANKEGP